MSILSSIIGEVGEAAGLGARAAEKSAFARSKNILKSAVGTHVEHLSLAGFDDFGRLSEKQLGMTSAVRAGEVRSDINVNRDLIPLLASRNPRDIALSAAEVLDARAASLRIRSAGWEIPAGTRARFDTDSLTMNMYKQFHIEEPPAEGMHRLYRGSGPRSDRPEWKSRMEKQERDTPGLRKALAGDLDINTSSREYGDFVRNDIPGVHQFNKGQWFHEDFRTAHGYSLTGTNYQNRGVHVRGQMKADLNRFSQMQYTDVDAKTFEDSFFGMGGEHPLGGFKYEPKTLWDSPAAPAAQSPIHARVYANIAEQNAASAEHLRADIGYATRDHESISRAVNKHKRKTAKRLRRVTPAFNRSAIAPGTVDRGIREVQPSSNFW